MDPAEKLFDQLPSSVFLTHGDVEELKSHFYDSLDDLKSNGLNEKEAFEVASMRLIKNFDFEREYANCYSDKIQYRNYLFILAGIAGFFCFYFIMALGGKIIFMILKNNIRILSQSLLLFLTLFHLFFSFIVIYFYKRINKIDAHINKIKITPKLLVIPIVLILVLNYINLNLDFYIRSKFISILLPSHYMSYNDYSRYTFFFLAIFCTALIVKKYFKFNNWRSLRKKIKIWNSNPDLKNDILQKFGQPIKELQNIGLNQDEAIEILKIRGNIDSNSCEDINLHKSLNQTLEYFAISLTGISIYLIFYFFLHSSSRVLLTVLQQINDDPIKNLSWVRWYIGAIHLVIIFFTVSFYFKDENFYRLKKIRLKNLNFVRIGLLISLFAIIDRKFYPVSKNVLHNNKELISSLWNLVNFSDLSFSLIMLIFLLILFNKYYKENLKIG